MLVSLVEALADALTCPPGDVWAYWEEVGAVRLGERTVGYDGHCPVVSIRSRQGRSEEQIASGLAAVAHAVSESMGVPLEDVWVHWKELAPGRVFAGGRVL
jgi:phenylpyruvate tautomerase PptA (4-oxalocrotonate tautomerase family)